MFEIFRGFVLGVLQIVSPIPLIKTDQSFHFSVKKKKKKKSIIKKSRSFSFLESVCIHHNYAIPSISSPEPAFVLVNTKRGLRPVPNQEVRESRTSDSSTQIHKLGATVIEVQKLRYKNWPWLDSVFLAQRKVGSADEIGDFLRLRPPVSNFTFADFRWWSQQKRQRTILRPFWFPKI